MVLTIRVIEKRAEGRERLSLAADDQGPEGLAWYEREAALEGPLFHGDSGIRGDFRTAPRNSTLRKARRAGMRDGLELKRGRSNISNSHERNRSVEERDP